MLVVSPTRLNHPFVYTFHRQHLWLVLLSALGNNPLLPAVLLVTEPAHIYVRNITFILIGGKKLALFDHNV